MIELDKLRKKIDKVNKELFTVLKNRFEVTREVGIIKAKNNLKSYDKNRENLILNKMKTLANEYNLNPIMIEKIFKLIMKEVVKEHKQIKKKLKDN